MTGRAEDTAAREDDVVTAGLSRKAVAWGGVLFLASLLVYNANFREISSADTIGTRLIPASIVLDRTLTLDRYYRDEPALPYWIQRAGAHYVSSYPVLPALLAVPVYLLPILTFGDSWALINLLAKLTASLVAALSVLFVYLALRRLAPGSAVGLALVYAFGTSTWSVASQGLWGHGAAELFMAMAIYCAARAASEPHMLTYGGLAAGLMVASRPATGLVAAALLLHALYRDRREGSRALAAFGAVLALLSAYNLYYFGSLQGGYAELHAEHATFHGVAGPWASSLGAGLLGLFASPSRGLLVYSPVLVLAGAGLVRAFGLPRGQLMPFLAAGTAASLLMLGKFAVWWGGHSFGPRLATDFLPALAVLMVPGWQALATTPLRRSVRLALVALSVGVQAVGAFYYPSPREVDWNTSPRDVDTAHDRLWDWRDTQLGRLLGNGPRPLGFGAEG